jgi:MoaA/NifB/PqqE/SkfB family radical SAM enzyme
MTSFYQKITNIQIEHSTICNAACPQCLRESKSGDYSWFNQTYIPTEFYETRIPQHAYDNFEIINFCGALGDPCTAPNFLDVIRLVKQKSPRAKISIATNGGMKSPAWWSELGSMLGDNDHVIFGIDGLKDTNGIYRINVRWNNVINNLKAFIAGGGNAHWQFISFAHNEHQIKEAETLAQSLGVKRFFTLYNNRFVTEELTGSSSVGADGKKLLPPIAEQEKHKLLCQTNPPVVDHQEWVNVAEKGCITCEAKTLHEAYIDVNTHLFPCCYIAGAFSTREPGQGSYDGFYDLYNQHGGDLIKLSKYDWEDILASGFYKAIEDSWTKKFGDGRLFVCSAICAKTEARINFYKNKKD